MDNRSKEVFAENFKWLNKNAEEHMKLTDGVISAITDALKREHLRLTPDVAKREFDSLGASDTKLFALFCKSLWEADACDSLRLARSCPDMTVYLRSPVSNKAFDGFCKTYPRLRAMYAADFKSVCEEVYYERADSCILPMLGSSDGLFTAFRQMLMKYELKITATCTVHTDEDSYQVMALLTGEGFDTDGDTAELCLPSAAADALADVHTIAGVFGADVERITSIPSKYNDGFDHHISLRADSRILEAVRFCLDAKFPANILLGQYKKYN